MPTSQTYTRGNLATDPLRNFRFLVKFVPLGTNTAGQPDLNTIKYGFTSVSGLNISTESIPYREGQHNTTVRQIPGQSTFSPITFQRGVVLGSPQNWQWMEMLFRANDDSTAAGVNPIGANVSFRFNVEVDVLLHPVKYASKDQLGYNPNNPTDGAEDDKAGMRFTIYNAWPTSLAYSDFNAGDNALLVEQMTLVHEGFDINWNPNPAPNSTPQGGGDEE